LRSAYLIVGDRDRAEDLVQTALVKTYLAWSRIRDIDAVESYARRVMVTTAVSWWRKHRREVVGDVPELMVESGADAVDARVDAGALWRHIVALPRRQRAVVVLRFYEGLSHNEIAELMSLSPVTVRSHLSRALATLRPHVESTAVLTREAGEAS
jgi:RNA polymerase sigma-70 factor (sigma-E family)